MTTPADWPAACGRIIWSSWLAGKQTARLALSKAGDALSEGTRDDAGEHVPEAGAKIPGMPEMPKVLDGKTL